MADPALPRSAAGDRSPWLIAVVVSLATFMEVLDSTIANVSLRHIAGGLGSSQDESTWILTSYLISNAIILPVSGWLSMLIGRKRFYMICVAIFTGSSLLCALAPSLPWMIGFRVLQGLGGGGLAPTEQSIFADSFPPEKRAAAFAMYGVTVVVAPAIGPVLGGWLTESWSWHWIFLINLPVGLVALTLIWFLVDEPPAVVQDTKDFRARFVPDWLGFVLVAMTFGALQVTLDRFDQDDGFASESILVFFTVTVFSGLALVWWERQHPQPVFDVRLFKVRSFAVANLLMFLLGFTLYSTTQIIPMLVQNLLHYDALEAGKCLALGGVTAAMVMPLAGVVSTRVPGKLLLVGAFVATAFAFFHTSTLNSEVSFRTLSLTRVYQSLPLPFLFVTLTTAGYVGVPPDKNSEASAIINLMRNLGGSVGVAAATTGMSWRTQVHHARLAEHVTPFDTLVQQALDHAHGSLAALQQAVQTQAQLMSYMDIFHLWAYVALAVAPFALLLKNPPKGAPVGH
ncbi:DHA2 family efflux MFS transporter permease subunit [Paucibacter sp. R3-3]|uniref:DHA2 family efflux MFS transporter permease subunit n=1 Tax=Roseateles agri TaxID=3098619 RepID=A0ABU5DPZ2_9BURK|nr:DHA2 family efflux MFS transporter permease subunit [Paucibacter sp. R3-3]MDY0747705.1 DHA2 family efflux MFS transporter permease subunit [Paucibacter sp. R3-3]